MMIYSTSPLPLILFIPPGTVTFTTSALIVHIFMVIKEESDSIQCYLTNPGSGHEFADFSLQNDWILLRFLDTDLTRAFRIALNQHLISLLPPPFHLQYYCLFPVLLNKRAVKCFMFFIRTHQRDQAVATAINKNHNSLTSALSLRYKNRFACFCYSAMSLQTIRAISVTDKCINLARSFGASNSAWHWVWRSWSWSALQ